MKISFLAIAFLFSACANLGPNFEVLQHAKKTKALVYVYRPSAFTGSARSPDIVFNDKKVGTAVNGSYFFFEIDPGQAAVLQRNFAGEKTGEISVNLKENKIYFLRVDLGMPTLKQSVDSSGKVNAEVCPFQGLNLTFRDHDLTILNAMDERLQSRSCWPGFMFVTEELANRELPVTGLSK